MSTNLTPVVSGPSTALGPVQPVPPPVAYRPTDAGAPPQGGQQLGRILAALNRFKWLTLALVIVGGIAGGIATRYVVPEYQVVSTLLITSPQGNGNSLVSGPIREEQTMDPQGWIDLLQSFAIADSVVMQLSLFLEPARAADSTLFRTFTLDRSKPGFIPGEYTLEVKGGRWTLRDKVGFVNESGVVGDSVGRRAGFAWVPARGALGTDRTVDFTVRTPRETSVEVLKRMNVGLARGSNVIIMRLTGTPQQKPAQTLNAWQAQFVRIATELKLNRVNQFSRILDTQRAEAAARLTAAERSYQQYRVGTIALPSEGISVRPGATGVEVKQDPVLDNYFQTKFQLDNLRGARLALERAATGLTPTAVPVEAILSVPAVTTDPAAITLRRQLEEYVAREQELRILRQTYTDSNKVLVPKLEQLRTLTTQTIPSQLNAYLVELRKRENDVAQTVGQAQGVLQGIPSRTIQQEQLRREVDAATALYNSLQSRYSDAELAEKSMTPDVRILDAAVMPLEPTKSTAPIIIGGALLAALGFGLGLSILLDRLDRRFRYPHQATSELGLQVLGIVPQIDQTRRQSAERVSQIVEAFRSIRMNVRYACMPNQKVTLTITSPGPNDGKSLIASNLALSFAEGGWRTALIDGDLRRGQLHGTFDLPAGPGLIEYLDGTSLLSEVIYQTHHDALSLIPTGTKHRRGPELLATPRMQQLVAALSQDFDAIIVDTPPLGAGTDAYAIGTATQHVAIVLRSEATDLKLAQAKLQVLDQLPVSVIGVVLNEVQVEGSMYSYYSYDPEYGVIEESPEEEPAQLTAGR